MQTDIYEDWNEAAGEINAVKGKKCCLNSELERAAGPGVQLIASRGPGRLAVGFPPTVLRTDQEGTITLAM